jgi:hypothetical protein
MSSLSGFSINLSKLKKEKITTSKNGDKWYAFTSSTNDDTDNYGNNIIITEPQTKEERDAKKGRDFLGNGKVFWTDGKITVAKKKEDVTAPAPAPAQESFNDLPF